MLINPEIALYVALFVKQLPYFGEGSGFPMGIVDPVQTVAGYLAVGVALAFFFLALPSSKRPVVKWNLTLVLMAVLILWEVVTLVWAPDFVLGRQKLANYLFGFATLFLSANIIRSEATVDGLMRAVALNGWVLVLLGISTLLTNFEFGERINVFGINANLFGVELIAFFPGPVWRMFCSTSRDRPYAVAQCMLFVACAAVLLLATGSRGGALALAVMIMSLWLWPKTRAFAAVATLGAIVAVLVMPTLLDSLRNRSAETWGDDFGSRGSLWEASVALVEQNLLTGVGVGNGPVSLRPYFQRIPSSGFTHDIPSHNPFLEVAVESGLPGLALYALACGSAIWSFVAFRKTLEARGGPYLLYFPLIFTVLVSYFFAWIKSGGMENHPTFFLMLIMMLVPSQLARESPLPAAEAPKEIEPVERISSSGSP